LNQSWRHPGAPGDFSHRWNSSDVIGCRLQEVQPRVKLNSTWSVGRAASGLRLNEHIEADGPTVFAHACKMGLEGIVSKRKDSPYRSGRSPDWIKSKNLACEAVKREAEEDWGR
jgi:ATP-dependent DNA ligase